MEKGGQGGDDLVTIVKLVSFVPPEHVIKLPTITFEKDIPRAERNKRSAAVK